MSANVGLSTPRGSGTSGYVQRNLSSIRQRDAPYTKDVELKHRQKKPDQEILEHNRKRTIEVKVFELRDKLEDEGVDEDEIDTKCEALRKELDGQEVKTVKPQTHERAEAKIEESEKLRRALGISKDYEEGGHWRKQEQKRLETMKKDVDRTDELGD